MSWLKRLFRKEQPPPEGQLQFDFIHTFPHVCWISSVACDEISPEGFRYKLLTSRREPEMVIEIVLLRQSVDGTKTIVSRMQGPVDGFDGAYELVEQLAQGKDVTFERFDLRHIRTFEEFQATAVESGWEMMMNE